MKVLRTRDEVRAWRATAGRVGLVPTMGALHAGHLSLVQRSVRENDATIASIFVNPTQFAPHEDFAAYPRREADDLGMLDGAGCAAAFVPSVDEMYPAGARAAVDPGAIAEPLEGRARPGHFAGVVTVVERLFDIARPDVAYFGQKDFQQLRVIQVVLGPRHPGLRIAGVPTVREPDGLAMSSRNAYLTPQQRRDAVALSRGLFRARDLWGEGVRDADRLKDEVQRTVRAGPGLSLEYVSVADPVDLHELHGEAPRAVVSLAARVGRARLIDNVLLGMDVSELS